MEDEQHGLLHSHSVELTELPTLSENQTQNNQVELQFRGQSWPREVARNHPGDKMQCSYCHAAFQPEVTPAACALQPLNPHFPSSPSEEEASEVSKP